MFGSTCGEDIGDVVRVSRDQRRDDPCEAVTREAHGMGHLEDGAGLLLGAVEQDDRTLQLLQLVLDLGVSVVHGHVQQEDFFQLPPDEAVVNGASDLHRQGRWDFAHITEKSEAVPPPSPRLENTSFGSGRQRSINEYHNINLKS